VLLRLFIVGLSLLAACQATTAQKLQALAPGQDIQAAIDNAPEGTLFRFEPGIYRLQSFKPKDGQRFIGADGTVLNGAMLLANWQQEGDTGIWVSESLPKPLPQVGKCSKGGDLCAYREDLFIDGKLLKRVATQSDLGPDRWLYKDGKAYLSIAPGGRTVELSVAPVAIDGSARDIVLRNLVVEKYASAAQQGAIDGRRGSNWQLTNVTIRWNHGVGLYIGSSMKVRNGSVSHNGQLGIGGDGDGAVIEGVEIAYNNYADFSSGWEAGGTKFVYSENLRVRNNCVHHNFGPGLWTDIDNKNILYEGNKVFANTGDGIKHEISYDAIIRENIVGHNGREKDNWMWGSQILIQNSSNVQVLDNLVEVPTDYGNGIGLIYQDRGEGKLGPRATLGNTVTGNTIVFLGGHGATGIVSDFDRDEFWRTQDNKFDRNQYVVRSQSRRFWEFGGGRRAWTNLQGRGVEVKGSITESKRTPTPYGC
jgi:hypothetical protein